MSKLCKSAHMRMSGQVSYCCHKSCLRGLSFVYHEIGLPPKEKAGELFEVTGEEPDLFSPHLW